MAAFANTEVESFFSEFVYLLNNGCKANLALNCQHGTVDVDLKITVSLHSSASTWATTQRSTPARSRRRSGRRKSREV